MTEMLNTSLSTRSLRNGINCVELNPISRRIAADIHLFTPSKFIVLILKLVVCILLRVLGQVKGFRLTQHWF
jgi:hypothetical protein